MPSPRAALLSSFVFAAIGVAGPAIAAPNLVASRTAVAQAISDCRKVADKDARLDCYDKAADAFEQAQQAGQVVVVDRAQMHEVKRQAFGFALPSLNLFTRGPKEEDVKDVTVKLTGAHEDATGKWVMVTEENAVWRQTDDSELFNPPPAGSSVAIRRAALGSFFCNVDRQTAIRCARTQ